MTTLWSVATLASSNRFQGGGNRGLLAGPDDQFLRVACAKNSNLLSQNRLYLVSVALDLENR